MKRRAGVYLREDLLIIYPESQTTAGVWLAQEPLTALSPDSNAREKGMALRSTLAESRLGIPHPTSFGRQFDRFLEMADVKNWRAFVKRTKAVGIEERDREIVMTPERNLGAKDGFVELLDKAFTLPVQAGDEELGMAVDRALELSEATPPA